MAETLLCSFLSLCDKKWTRSCVNTLLLCRNSVKRKSLGMCFFFRTLFPSENFTARWTPPSPRVAPKHATVINGGVLIALFSLDLLHYVYYILCLESKKKSANLRGRRDRDWRKRVFWVLLRARSCHVQIFTVWLCFHPCAISPV